MKVFEIYDFQNKEKKVEVEAENQVEAFKKTLKKCRVLTGNRVFASDLNFKGWDLKGLEVKDANLCFINFTGADLRGSSFEGCTFDQIAMDNAKIENMRIPKIKYTDSTAWITVKDVNPEDFKSIKVKEPWVFRDISYEQISQMDLSKHKKNLFKVLKKAIPEIPKLKQKIKKGKIDGEVYYGKCRCLVGSIAGIREVDLDALKGITADSESYIESFVYGIKEGHKPDNNSLSRLLLEWIEEFEQSTKRMKDKLKVPTQKLK